MSAYLAELKREAAAANARAERQRAMSDRPLQVRIRDWWQALPEPARGHGYSMEDLTKIFGASGAQIGQALHALGWRRYRVWGPGPYRRLWSAASEARAEGGDPIQPAPSGTAANTRSEGVE
jgi:hypothetical protein